MYRGLRTDLTMGRMECGYRSRMMCRRLRTARSSRRRQFRRRMMDTLEEKHRSFQVFFSVHFLLLLLSVLFLSSVSNFSYFQYHYLHRSLIFFIALDQNIYPDESLICLISRASYALRHLILLLQKQLVVAVPLVSFGV